MYEIESLKILINIICVISGSWTINSGNILWHTSFITN